MLNDFFININRIVIQTFKKQNCLTFWKENVLQQARLLDWWMCHSWCNTQFFGAVLLLCVSFIILYLVFRYNKSHTDVEMVDCPLPKKNYFLYSFFYLLMHPGFDKKNLEVTFSFHSDRNSFIADVQTQIYSKYE